METQPAPIGPAAQLSRRRLLLLGLGASLTLGGFAAWFAVAGRRPPNRPTLSGAQSAQPTAGMSGALPRSTGTLPACATDRLFTTVPMQAADYLAFRPLGWLSPPVIVFPHKHSSFSITPPGEAGYRRKPVVFPGDVTVTRLNTTEWLGKNTTGYQLYFAPCDQVQAYFYHLGELTPALTAILANPPQAPQCRQYAAGYNTDVKLCQYAVQIAVKAGDLAGYSGDGAGVDFGMTDFRQPALAFANPDDYTPELLHYVSPISYFTRAAQAELLTKTGSYDGAVRRTRDPQVGEIAQDIAGTAQGNWFTTGQTWNQFPPPDPAPFLALVHDYVGPEPVFSIGNSLPGVKAGLYSFTPEATGTVNRDFRDVKPGAIYCYDRWRTGTTTGQVMVGPIDGVLLIELEDDQTLMIEKLGSAGATCANTNWKFTEQATIYQR